MDTKLFHYDLPEEKIAQSPVTPRDSSRLLYYNREDKDMRHMRFYDIKKFLRPGDTLVLNSTRVIPARLIGEKKETGMEVEFLLLNRLSSDTWESLIRPGRKLYEGDRVVFGGRLEGEIIKKGEGGVTIVKFCYEGVFEAILDELGKMPLPPYIKKTLLDKERYQTVYSKEPGSAAAPTAGLHFTKKLLGDIGVMGVNIAPILLHVGLGTFRPVKTDKVEEHNMHGERFYISRETADIINNTKEQGGRVIAVGTTSVRALESVAEKDGKISPFSGETDIFIYPGYKFKCVDAIITNFHLPESTLLMLVCAFAGVQETLGLYDEALKENYRFFSFGDAMLIV